MSELLLDRDGRRRSPATIPGFHAGHASCNKGLRSPEAHWTSSKAEPSVTASSTSPTSASDSSPRRAVASIAADDAPAPDEEQPSSRPHSAPQGG
jgi:hypothetical protein